MLAVVSRRFKEIREEWHESAITDELSCILKFPPAIARIFPRYRKTGMRPACLLVCAGLEPEFGRQRHTICLAAYSRRTSDMNFRGKDR